MPVSDPIAVDGQPAVRTRSRLGQATVEFSLALPLVLVAILSLLQLGFYTIESGTAKNAAAVGSLVAAGSAPNQVGTAGIATVYDAIRGRLASGLFGARIERQSPVNGSCPRLSSSWPIGVVYVCSSPVSGQPAAEVSIRGWVPALVPPTFGLFATRAGGLSIDVRTYVRTLVFAA